MIDKCLVCAGDIEKDFLMKVTGSTEEWGICKTCFRDGIEEGSRIARRKRLGLMSGETSEKFLLPCPFCRETPHISATTHYSDPLEPAIECLTEGCALNRTDDDGAHFVVRLSLWNRRK